MKSKKCTGKKVKFKFGWKLETIFQSNWNEIQRNKLIENIIYILNNFQFSIGWNCVSKYMWPGCVEFRISVEFVSIWKLNTNLSNCGNRFLAIIIITRPIYTLDNPFSKQNWEFGTEIKAKRRKRKLFQNWFAWEKWKKTLEVKKNSIRKKIKNNSNSTKRILTKTKTKKQIALTETFSGQNCWILIQHTQTTGRESTRTEKNQGLILPGEQAPRHIIRREICKRNN